MPSEDFENNCQLDQVNKQRAALYRQLTELWEEFAKSHAIIIRLGSLQLEIHPQLASAQ